MNEIMLPQRDRWITLKQQGIELINSGFLPSSINTPEKFMAVIIKGNEIGIPPMQACAHINIINGKPAMSAELMLSQVFKMFPQTKISYPVRSSERCEIKVTRPGCEPSTFIYTIQDAEKAGLLKNPTWVKYPRAMLHARCVSEMARSLFPDALAGISYTPEELGANVNENGECIDVTPIATTSTEQDSKNTQTTQLVSTPAQSPVASSKAKDVSNPSPAAEGFNPTNAGHLKSLIAELERRKIKGQWQVNVIKAMAGKTMTDLETVIKVCNPEAPDEVKE